MAGTENMEAVPADRGGEILKPRTDKREYRRIVLENSLEVLLISDPETDKVRSIHVLVLLLKEQKKRSLLAVYVRALSVLLQ